VLFSASTGAGALTEALSVGVGGGGGGDDDVAGGGGARALRCGGSPRARAELVLCESFEPSHSDHGASARVAAALGTTAPPLRLDSMAKYGLLARGCGDVYVRLPQRGYTERVWDHAPGALILREAGGAVTDASGLPLDFSLGATLAANKGVIAAADKQLHALAVLAVKAERGE
jgi:3'(2'), 5'-bisphosphate nucleotidase